MSSEAALVFRIKLEIPFGSMKAHGTENFFSSGNYSLMTATQEDQLFLKWARGYSISGMGYANYSRYLQKQIKYHPIPSSARDVNKDEYDAKGNRKSRYGVVNTVKNVLYQTGFL